MMALGSGERRFRVAVAGLRVGREHLVALAKHPAAEIRAVCDPVEERAREMARAFGVPPIYADYEAMLAAEDLDGVCIATPNRLHAPMIRAALRRGLHVMCEKPLALDAAEARDLLAEARAAGVTHAPNFSNRPNPAVHHVQAQRAADGPHGLVRVSRVARGRCDIKRVELYGERASLVLELDKGVTRVLRADEPTVWRGDGFRVVFASDPNVRTWGGNVLAWVDASLARLQMRPSFEDGLRCQEILDAALRSHAERCWIDVSRQ